MLYRDKCLSRKKEQSDDVTTAGDKTVSPTATRMYVQAKSSPYCKPQLESSLNTPTYTVLQKNNAHTTFSNISSLPPRDGIPAAPDFLSPYTKLTPRDKKQTNVSFDSPKPELFRHRRNANDDRSESQHVSHRSLGDSIYNELDDSYDVIPE